MEEDKIIVVHGGFWDKNVYKNGEEVLVFMTLKTVSFEEFVDNVHKIVGADRRTCRYVLRCLITTEESGAMKSPIMSDRDLQRLTTIFDTPKIYVTVEPKPHGMDVPFSTSQSFSQPGINDVRQNSFVHLMASQDALRNSFAYGGQIPAGFHCPTSYGMCNMHPSTLFLSAPYIHGIGPNLSPYLSAPYIDGMGPSSTPVINQSRPSSAQVTNQPRPNSAPIVDQQGLASAPVIKQSRPSLPSVVGRSAPSSARVTNQPRPNSAPIVDQQGLASAPVIKQSRPSLPSVVNQPKLRSTPVVNQPGPNSAQVLEQPRSGIAVDQPRPNAAPAVDQPRPSLAPAQWKWRFEKGREWHGHIKDYSQYKLVGDIQAQLIECKRLAEFEASCFGHFLCFDTNAYLCDRTLIALLGREIRYPNGKSYERWFRVGQQSLRFSKLEFCMVMGLKFGASTFNPKSPDHEVPIDGVYRRHFDGQKVAVDDLWAAFIHGDFRDHPDDALKVAYVLMVLVFLFGVDGRKPVNEWIWTLVEDPTLFNNFPWGTYTFQRLCHFLNSGIRHPIGPWDSVQFFLYGFPMALQLWAYECIPSLGKICGEKISDDFPRCVRWKCPKRKVDLTYIFDDPNVKMFNPASIFDDPNVVCLQIEPSQIEKEQPYMIDIEMNVLEGVKYVHHEHPIGRRALLPRERKPSPETICSQSNPPSWSLESTLPTNRRLRQRTATEPQFRAEIVGPKVSKRKFEG